MSRGKSIMDYRAEGLLRATHGYVPAKDVKGRYLVSKMNITGFYMMVILLLGFLALLLFYAQFSGVLRWIIVLLIVSSMGFGVAFLSSRKTSSPERLSSVSDIEKRPWNEISRLIGILERAEKNYRYSQLAALERIRRAIIDGIQTQRDISDEEIEKIVHDRNRLIEITDDEEVADFLLASERDLSNWSTIVREKLPVMGSFRGSRSFSQSVLPILEKMEDWQ
ncbi:MAG: hypothetical protein ACE5QW_02090 [Thermoplasmata archaeon]